MKQKFGGLLSHVKYERWLVLGKTEEEKLLTKTQIQSTYESLGVQVHWFRDLLEDISKNIGTERRYDDASRYIQLLKNFLNETSQ